jgi:hypothetical protein
MSGMYKWTEVMFDPSAATYDVTTGALVLAAVLAARTTAATAEAACRLEAEESVLREILGIAKEEGLGALSDVRKSVESRAGEITDHERKRLLERLNEAESAIEAARNHTGLRDALLGAERVRVDFDRAVRRKRADDIRRGNTDAISAWRSHFEALRSQSLALDETESAADPEGAAFLKTAIATAAGALQTANENMIAARVSDLETALAKHQDAIDAARERAMRSSALGAQAVAEAKAIVVGLRADPVVMRWHTHAVDVLEQDLEQVGAMVASSEPDQAMRMVREARERADSIVREANGAQIKADQRDYIANSITRSLEEMGFVVGPLQAEHPDHPATAVVVHAATASGKNIAVSVPVEGNVWYNVQGFPKSTETAVGGGDAAVCDEAEAVITEMHECLLSEFHIKMGELMWDGKDTDRKLRAVQSLPKGQSSDRSTSGTGKK